MKLAIVFLRPWCTRIPLRTEVCKRVHWDSHLQMESWTSATDEEAVKLQLVNTLEISIKSKWQQLGKIFRQPEVKGAPSTNPHILFMYNVISCRV